MNVVIGIPSSGLVNSSFALDNLPGIIAYTRNHRPDIGLFVTYRQGVRTDRNRNEILQNCLTRGDIDYILWLDEDMLYPHDIICRYLEHDFDVIGCLYFKRAEPFSPIGYIKNKNPTKPYNALEPTVLPKTGVIEVDALGYGGMMVKMSSYDKMGDKKWTHYGSNYHLPFECEDKLTHDMQFCADVQSCGLKIKLHVEIRPGHIGEKIVTGDDWHNPRIKNPKVTVIMPSIDMELANKSAKLMKKRAGFPCTMLVVEDIDRTGFMATIQKAINNNPSDFYVYTAQDAFAGNDWLKIGIAKIEETGAGLLAFNNGRWGGKMAAFGLIRHSWMVENYGGKLFYPGYQTHYGDVELTLIAKDQGKFAYDPDAVMTEVDYDKDGKGTNGHDKTLFNQRKLTGFDGKVKNEELLQFFS